MISKKFSTKTFISLSIFIIIILFAVAKISTVLAADTTSPTAPSQLIAVPVSSSQVSLTWMASTDDVGVTGYNVYENGNQIATSTTNSFYVSSLNYSTTYSFTVVAYDAAGNISSQSNAASATTTAVLPPAEPALTITTVSPTQINLTWTASTSNVGIAGYYVYENGSKIGTTTATFYSVNSLSLSTTYNFGVAAYDTLGNTSEQSVVVTTTPSPVAATVILPSAPTNLTASPVSSSQIDLTWTASTGSVNVAGYDVYQNGSQITTTANTYYVVTSLTAGTAYSFTVAAYDTAGNTSAQSASAGATTQSVGQTVTAPVIPTIPTPTPITPALVPGCLSTYGFSTTTGQSCIPNPMATSSGGTTGFTFTLKIQRGSSGNEVLELQKFLNNAGYPCGTPDGKFGLKTKTSLAKFQVANNLKGDGVVGAMTRVALNK